MRDSYNRIIGIFKGAQEARIQVSLAHDTSIIILKSTNKARQLSAGTLKLQETKELSSTKVED